VISRERLGRLDRYRKRESMHSTFVLIIIIEYLHRYESAEVLCDYVTK
jgi:hypothetical protein